MNQITEGIFLVEETMPCEPRSFALFLAPGATFSPFGKHEYDVTAGFLLAFSWANQRWVGVDAKTFMTPIIDHATKMNTANDELLRLIKIAQSLPPQLIVDAVHELKRRGLIRLERTNRGDVLWPTAMLVETVR